MPAEDTYSFEGIANVYSYLETAWSLGLTVVDTFNKTLSHVLTFSKLIFRVLYSLLAMIDSIDWLQNRHSFMTVKSEL